MHALVVSAVIVAVAEIGDRTQLLSFILASRFRRPVPIIFGILGATVANHAAAAFIGRRLGSAIDGQALRWGLGLSFLAMAAWALLPDKIDATDKPRFGGSAFLATLVSFFIAEMGDKTQIATAALAARFDDLSWVVLGTTAGMLVANLPVVVCGHFISHRFDPRWARYGAAALFAAQGIVTLLGSRLF